MSSSLIKETRYEWMAECVIYPDMISYPQMTWIHQNTGTGIPPGCLCTARRRRCQDCPHTRRYLHTQTQRREFSKVCVCVLHVCVCVFLTCAAPEVRHEGVTTATAALVTALWVRAESLTAAVLNGAFINIWNTRACHMTRWLPLHN